VARFALDYKLGFTLYDDILLCFMFRLLSRHPRFGENSKH